MTTLIKAVAKKLEAKALATFLNQSSADSEKLEVKL
jgi:hypothetical protein